MLLKKGLLCGLLCCLATAANADDYQGGVNAYNKGNHALALKKWSTSTDPRSWYMVGKMALYGEIPDCDPVHCAATWFYKSGDAGYIPALIDLASLDINNGYRDAGVQVLQIAARWNNPDARRILAEMSENVPSPDLYEQYLLQQQQQAQAAAAAQAQAQQNLANSLMTGLAIMGAINAGRASVQPRPITSTTCTPGPTFGDRPPTYTCQSQ